MKPVPITSSTSVKRALPLLGALLLFSSLLLLSCGDLSENNDDDNDGPKFSIDLFAGDGTTAEFNDPSGIAVTSDGTVYVADKSNHRIRKITSAGEVTTFAGSGTGGFVNEQGTMAQFDNPTGIAVDSDGNVYVVDYTNNRIRKITSAGKVTLFAGSGAEGSDDGQGDMAEFNFSNGIAIGPKGDLYVTDSGNTSIRKITSAGEVTTFVKGTTAQFSNLSGIAVASDGTIYVADIGSQSIQKITSDGTVDTLAGGGTPAEFNNPQGIAVASDGTVYVADSGNDRIRKITSAGEVTTIVKDLKGPSGIVLSSDGSTAYVTADNQIFKLSNISRAGAALEITLVQSQTNPLDGSQITSTNPSTISLTTLGTLGGTTSPDSGDALAINLTATSNIPGAGTPTWSVTPIDGSIATVTPDGANAKLKGVASGTATLTVTINGLRKTVDVTVTSLSDIFGGGGGLFGSGG